MDHWLWVLQDLDGQSIAKLVSNPTLDWNEIALTSKDKEIHSLRNENYRYIVYSDGFEELYDHRVDQNEWNNIANNSSSKDILKMFRIELKKVIK